MEDKSVFNEEKINNRIDELVAMEKGFNIARESDYETFMDWHRAQRKKEYEIISFKHKGLSYTKWHDEFYHRTDGKYYNTSLNHVPQNAEILSVKRIYDGEVFSVGEKVYLKASDGKGVFYIRKFTIKDGQCFASSGINIMQLEKVKEVLFTTEDGVGIHEGDTYYTLEPDNNWYLYYSGAAGDGSGKRTIAKYFSTKEAAEDWLNWNKPKYSKKEMEACYEHALTQGLHGCSFKSYMNWIENF